MNKRIITKTIGILIALILWQVISMIVEMEMLFASPFQVIKTLFLMLKNFETYKTVLYSTARVFGGFFSAFVLGTLLGIIAGEFQVVEDLLWPFTTTVKTIPVASFIVIFLIWFDSGITLIISFLISFPVIYGNVLQGIKSTDKKLLEVAKIYKMPFRKRFHYVNLPTVRDYLLSASSTAVGMAWKAGVAAEVIGVTSFSIGEKLNDAKIYCDNAGLLSWTLIIIISCIILEKIFIAVVKFVFGRLLKK